MFHDRSLLGRCFPGFVLPVFGVLFCSVQIHTLNYWTVQSVVPSSLTGGVFECDIAHRPSVAVLCMLYKIRCNPMHPFNDALPVPYVPVRVTRSALVAHRYTYAPPCCRTLQYPSTFVLLSVSPWNDLADRWCRTGGFQEQGQCFFYGLSCPILTKVCYSFFPFLIFLSIDWYCGAGVFGLIGCTSLSLCLALPTSFINNNW